MSLHPIPTRNFGPPGSAIAQRLNGVADHANTLRNISFGAGFEVRRLQVGMTVNLNQSVLSGSVDTKPILARLDSWALVTGSDSQWIYTMKATNLVLGAGGALGQFPKAGDQEFVFEAYNLNEINNVALGTGVQGNSVDDSGADYPAGFALQPVGGGTGGVPGNLVVLPCWQWPIDDGATIYWFQYENAVDGSCT